MALKVLMSNINGRDSFYHPKIHRFVCSFRRSQRSTISNYGTSAGKVNIFVIDLVVFPSCVMA